MQAAGDNTVYLRQWSTITATAGVAWFHEMYVIPDVIVAKSLPSSVFHDGFTHERTHTRTYICIRRL